MLQALCIPTRDCTSHDGKCVYFDTPPDMQVSQHTHFTFNPVLASFEWNESSPGMSSGINVIDIIS